MKKVQGTLICAVLALGTGYSMAAFEATFESLDTHACVFKLQAKEL